MNVHFHRLFYPIVLLGVLLLCLHPARSHAQAGSPDPGFNPSAGAAGSIPAIVVQGDGKILIAGHFTGVNGVTRHTVARLNADGSLDTGFDLGAGADDPVPTLPMPPPSTVEALAVQADGKIVLVGNFTSFHGESRDHVARLNADGSLDGIFGQSLTFTTGNSPVSVDAVAVQPDGKVLLAGHFYKINGVARHSTARLNADGSLDTTFVTGFAPPDFGAERYVTSLAVQPDGKVVIGGYIPDGKERLQISLDRLNADGSVDPSFHEGGGEAGFGSIIRALALQPDGRIVVAGSFVGVYGRFGPLSDTTRRINADGSVDGSFAPVHGGEAPINNPATVSFVAVQTDGKIVIEGDFIQVDGVPRNGLARLNADGSLDTSFDPGEGYHIASSLALQPDGKILLAADIEFEANGRIFHTRVVRLNGGSSPVVPGFFNGAVDVGSDFYYLPSFGYYNLRPQSDYVYHNDLGVLYFVDANDGNGGIYFYDFATPHEFAGPRGSQSLRFVYTSPSLFPYLYSFELNTFLYYFPDLARGIGFYTTLPRVFVRLDTGETLLR